MSTQKLTDTLSEQTLLEQIIEETKPTVPMECQQLDYVLSTPFRYGAIYPKGSRFRRAGPTEGVFYAALKPETALAEIAFYRLLFFAESPDTPWPMNATEFTAFSAHIRTEKLLDLTSFPLNEDNEIWSSLFDYQGCQNFAEAARNCDADIIQYASVRDPQKGLNFAILRCRAFAKPTIGSQQTWRLHFGRSGIRAIREFPKLSLEFPKNIFLKDPRLEGMTWERF